MSTTSVRFLNSSILIRLTSNLKNIYISGQWIQPTNYFWGHHGPKGQHRPKVNNKVGISKILNFHQIDLKFEVDLYFRSLNSTRQLFLRSTSHPQEIRKTNKKNFSGVLTAPMFSTLKISEYIYHFIFWSRSKYICPLTLYGTKWWRYQHAYSHVCLILSDSLILIFKDLKIEERMPRSLKFFFLIF